MTATMLEVLQAKLAYEFAFDSFPDATSSEKIIQTPDTEERVSHLLYSWRNGYYRSIEHPAFAEMARRQLYALMHEHYHNRGT